MCFGAGAGMASASTSTQATTSKSMSFSVYRNGSRIGDHRLVIEQVGQRTMVDIDIAFDVKFAFVTLYRYRHNNREVWDNQGLVNFKSTTDDDGERHVVAAERIGDMLHVAGTGSSLKVPASTLPTTYWHRSFVDTNRWIDTQAGRLINAEVVARGAETIKAAGRMIDADRFALQGDLDLELWYQGEQWVKLRFTASDDSVIDYELDSATGLISELSADALPFGSRRT